MPKSPMKYKFLPLPEPTSATKYRYVYPILEKCSASELCTKPLKYTKLTETRSSLTNLPASLSH